MVSEMFSSVTLEGLQLLRGITCLLYRALGMAEFWLFRPLNREFSLLWSLFLLSCTAMAFDVGVFVAMASICAV
ncbi:hypothetical protein U1Q18_002836, partial [Sarracenia purpurea var. burkii]